MWQERQAELLREEIEVLLKPLSEIRGLYDLAKEPLAKPRRGLSVDVSYDHPWSLLPLIVCEAICGHYEHAIPAAAAFQLLLGAGDVFDDIEDADSSESLSSRYGSAVATNVATTLLILAEKAITRLKRKGRKDGLIVHIIDVVNSYYITACAGQHLDLSLNFEMAVLEDVYLRVITMKSASQIECSCRVGALLANTKQELVEIFAKFGYNLGIASQISNDIQGVINGSDIANRTITLPLIYALNQASSRVSNQLKLVFRRPSESLLVDTEQIRDLLFRTGAIHYATIEMEFYKQRAMDILSKAEAAGARVERLKLFLE